MRLGARRAYTFENIEWRIALNQRKLRGTS